MKEKQQTSGNTKMRIYWENLLRNQDFLMTITELTDLILGSLIRPDILEVTNTNQINPRNEDKAKMLAKKYYLQYKSGLPFYEMVHDKEVTEESLSKLEVCFFVENGNYLTLHITPLAEPNNIIDFINTNSEIIKNYSGKFNTSISTNKLKKQKSDDFIWNCRDIFYKKGWEAVVDEIENEIKKDNGLKLEDFPGSQFPGQNDIYNSINRQEKRRITKREELK